MLWKLTLSSTFVLPLSIFFFFCLFRAASVSRLGVESELQPLAYAVATTTRDLSQVCDLHHSSQQHWILNPLSEARNWTCVLMDTSQICFCWAIMGSTLFFFSFFLFMAYARGQVRAVAEAHATVRATPDLSCICNLCCSLQQCQILNPLRGQESNHHAHGHSVQFF